MNADAYTKYLLEHGVDGQAIKDRIPVIRAFEDWLIGHGTDIASAGKTDIAGYAKHLIAEGTNTLENYYALCGYALWLGLRSLYVALVEVTDCHNGMEVLRDAIGKRHGADVRDQIFREPAPPLGADEAERLAYTKTISERMNALLTIEEIRAAWFQVQHGISGEDWQTYDSQQRKKYADCESPEVFVEQMLKERSALVSRLYDEKKLWFTQEITDGVLAFLAESPYLRLGEHNGRKGIIVTKVPYMTERFMQETDETMKRYYACHCPLVREAIRNGETLPGDVCYCSLGHASHFLSGIGLDHLQGEVLGSVVQGDDRCRFIFYLPEEPVNT